MFDFVDLTNLAKDIFDHNVKVGWWDPYPVRTDRYEDNCCLVMTELAEAAEGFRKDLMDDHLPDLKMAHVELADALIRMLDYIGAVDLECFVTAKAVQYAHAVLLPRSDLSRIWAINCVLVRKGYREAVPYLFAMAQIYECPDLLHMVARKRKYNAQRADHKIENRMAPGGKRL